MPRKVLAITLLVAFAMWAPLLVIPPLESIIASELGLSHTQSSFAYSAPILMLAIVALPAGFLADRIGLKRTIGIGIVFVAAGAVLRGTATSFGTLIAFTLVYGLGVGLSFPNLPKLARHCSPEERVHVNTGVLMTAVMVAGALPLAITRPIVYPALHLSGSFYVWSVPAVVAAVLWWTLIKEPPCASSGTDTPRADLSNLRRVARRGDLYVLAIVFLLHNFFFYTWSGWLPEFLTTIGESADLAGLATSVTLWVGIPSVLLLTELSYRLRRRKPFIWAPSLLLGGTAFAMIAVNAPLSWVLIVLVGIASTTRFVLIVSAPVELVPAELGGTASGLVMSIGYSGALLGPVVGGLILDRTGGYFWTFIAMALASFGTAALSWFLPETGRRRGSS